jgi:hypothetical protein
LNTTSPAVFISYASQDAEAAGRICEALQAAGIEVWFDQRELRGGDAWDQSIRKQVKDCALFVPLISANSARFGCRAPGRGRCTKESSRLLRSRAGSILPQGDSKLPQGS